MNREIKFRAVISEQTMIYFTLTDLINPLFSIREILIPWLLEGNKPDEYASLKDKNGKEIYEGDVVSIYGQRFLVDWVNYGFDPFVCFNLAGDKTRFNKMLQHTEIIGNIYENPELLGVKE